MKINYREAFEGQLISIKVHNHHRDGILIIFGTNGAIYRRANTAALTTEDNKLFIYIKSLSKVFKINKSPELFWTRFDEIVQEIELYGFDITILSKEEIRSDIKILMKMGIVKFKKIIKMKELGL